MSSPVVGAGDRAPGRRGGHPFALLGLAFAAIVAGFVGATLYGEMRSSQIDQEARQIETNSLPSVERIVAAESGLRHLEVATEEYVHGTDAERRVATTRIQAARRVIERELAAEIATGMYPGEADLTAATTRALVEMDAQIARMISGGEAAGGTFREEDVRTAIERVDAALDRLLSLNATQAHDELTRIARVRAGSMRLAFGLDLLCVLFAAAAAVVAVGALRRQRAAERAHEALLETRAAELEAFARRVAHDMLSPLSALSFTLSTIKRSAERGNAIDEPLERSFACLKRSQRLVDGVLDFARSAASPSGGERASLREALDGVLEEVEGEKERAGVEITVPSWEGRVVVPCAPGILASVISNLVRNAVKYIGRGDAEGDRGEKRVTIRVLPRAEDVRVEVEDTGPGVPLPLAEHIFEPYFRAPNNVQPGLGLGLATVKRFVEAHGGRVGVHPARDRGSVFWFQLPRVPAPAGEIPRGNAVTGR